MIKQIRVFGFIISAFFTYSNASAQVLAGSGTIPAVTGPTSWHTVSFATPFASTPVVLATLDATNPEPAAFRLRNVTATGFEIAVREPAGEDGLTPAQNFDFFAALPGIQTLPDGVTQVEFGLTKLIDIQHGTGVTGTESWADVNFSNPTIFGGLPPAVIANVQTAQNETTQPGTPSCPWLTDTINAITTVDFDLALERSEDPNCTNAEVIGWMAIADGASGNFVDSFGDTIYFEANLTGLDTQGWQNECQQQNLVGSYATPPMVFASKDTHRGGDGGWIRNCSKTTTQVGFTVDEDQALNAERSHIPEAVGYFIWSKKPHKYAKSLHQIERNGVVMPNGITVTDGDCVWFKLESKGNGTWYDVYEGAGWAFAGVYESDLTTLYSPAITPTAQDVDSDGDNEQVITINTLGNFEAYLQLCVDLQ